MNAPEGYTAIRFHQMEQLLDAIEGKEVWETPAGYDDLIAGLRIFDRLTPEGKRDGYVVYVRDKA